MDSKFTKVYLNLINEAKEAKKTSAADEYKTLVKEVVAEQKHWDSKKAEAMENLLAGFKNLDKKGILALKDKAGKLLQTPKFMVEYAKVLEELDVASLPFPYEKWAQLQLDFAEFIPNPDRDARRKMIRRICKFFDGTDAAVIVKLDEAEGKLRKLFSKYSQIK